MRAELLSAKTLMCKCTNLNLRHTQKTIKTLNIKLQWSTSALNSKNIHLVKIFQCCIRQLVGIIFSNLLFCKQFFCLEFLVKKVENAISNGNAKVLRKTCILDNGGGETGLKYVQRQKVCLYVQGWYVHAPAHTG